jgi:sugar phosphate isomerase/epimerase
MQNIIEQNKSPQTAAPALSSAKIHPAHPHPANHPANSNQSNHSKHDFLTRLPIYFKGTQKLPKTHPSRNRQNSRKTNPATPSPNFHPNHTHPPCLPPPPNGKNSSQTNPKNRNYFPSHILFFIGGNNSPVLPLQNPNYYPLANLPGRDSISVTVLSFSASLTRRAALLSSGLGLLSLRAAADPAPRNLKVAIFSKHLQFLQGVELARAAAEMGFDGIDLTVRSGGHVEPSRAAEDLPPLVALIRQHQLEVPMVTTDIVDADTPHARTVLQTMANLGIRYYRWGGFKYTADQPLAAQLDAFHKRSATLAALNAEYQVCAMYHTHSGIDLVGAPVWDMVEILKSLNPAAIGINYDIGHATVEGGLGGWKDSFRAAQPYLRGVAVKDFLWQKESADYQPAWVPLGEGMVRFPAFFLLLAQTQFDGPLQLHFEYPLFGADAGKRQLTADPSQVFSAMRRDLRQLHVFLKNAGLSHA